MQTPQFKKTIDTCKLSILNKANSYFMLSMLRRCEINDSLIVNTIKLDSSEENPTIDINYEWFKNFSLENQCSILAHVCLHYSLQHDLRLNNRIESLYQKACDIVVNNVLNNMTYILPEKEKGYAVIKKYSKLSVDEIYIDLLKDENIDSEETTANTINKKNASYMKSYGDMQFIRDPKKINDLKSKRTEEIAEIPYSENILKDLELVPDAKNSSSKGYSDDTETGINSLFKLSDSDQDIDWKYLLHKYKTEISNEQLSYIKFNRRYIAHGLYLPEAIDIAKMETIAMAVDVSGSVEKNQLQCYLNEIKTIKDILDPKRMIINTFNAAIVDSITITEEVKDIDKLSLRTNGGTNLSPVFTYYNKPENKPKILLVFSDLDCDPIIEEPDYDVIWICNDNPTATVNFGELIHIKTKWN